jgi:hypothetical protein
MRTCTKCKRSLALAEFGRSKSGPGGLNYWCKHCVRDNAERHRQRVVEELGREAVLAKRRALYEENKDEINKKRAVRQSLRRKHFTAQALVWQRVNKNKVATSKRQYRVRNLEKVLEYTRRYHSEHKLQRNRRVRERKKIDAAFKLRERLRSTFADKLRKAVRESANSSAVMPSRASVLRAIGCTLIELMVRLERQFEPGMSWANWGRGINCWNIDHIKPISSFDLMDKEQLHECWHFSNLRPLWAVANLKKGARYETKGYRE